MEKLVFSHKTKKVYKLISQGQNSKLLDLDNTLVCEKRAEIIGYTLSCIKPFLKKSFESDVFVADTIDQLIEWTNQNNDLVTITREDGPFVSEFRGFVKVKGVETTLVLTSRYIREDCNRYWTIEGYIPRIVLQFITREILNSIAA